GLAQQIDDALLGGKVDLADVILGFLLVGRDGVQAFDGAEDQFTGAARSAQGDVQHGLHGEDTWAVKESRESYQKAAPGVSAHWPANAHAGVRRCAPAWPPATLIGEYTTPPHARVEAGVNVAPPTGPPPAPEVGGPPPPT